jgi:thioredoxin-dependent peroxiredoxin
MKTKLAMGLLSLLGLASFAGAEPLAVGAPAPEVTSVDQDGKPVDLKEYAKGPTLVYFYPKADTPGCTKQACSIRDDWSKLQEKGIKVLGVSEDKPEAQKKFKEKHNLPFTLIADSDGKVAKAFGVPINVMGMTARQSFLIKDSKVVWTMPKASTSSHAADVLKAYEELKP